MSVIKVTVTPRALDAVATGPAMMSQQCPPRRRLRPPRRSRAVRPDLPPGPYLIAGIGRAGNGGCPRARPARPTEPTSRSGTAGGGPAEVEGGAATPQSLAIHTTSVGDGVDLIGRRAHAGQEPGVVVRHAGRARGRRARPGGARRGGARVAPGPASVHRRDRDERQVHLPVRWIGAVLRAGGTGPP